MRHFPPTTRDDVEEAASPRIIGAKCISKKR
jgi:hypothetical protein